MKAPFDIPGDLNTPVSAFLKLAPLRPRFLLESVEGGERLGRYSFIGFGDALDLRIDRDGLRLAWADRWLHIRPSGTEPIVRLIAEAPTPAEAEALVAAGRELLQ